MADPAFENSSRGDLQASGLVFDNAMSQNADTQMRDNLKGTDASGMVKADDSFERGLGGGDAAMNQAIQNKYARIHQGRQQQFMHEQKRMAQQMDFDRAQHASELVNREQQMNFEKALEKKRREQASRAARAGLIGQVCGIVVGAVAGAYTGGAGAAAGYAAGNAAGSAIAGG